MHANHAVRNLIREGKSHQLASVMQTNRKLGMITMDEAIVQLYFEGKIDREQAIQFARIRTAWKIRSDPEDHKMIITVNDSESRFIGMRTGSE